MNRCEFLPKRVVCFGDVAISYGRIAKSPHAVRPRYWDARLRENRGKTMEFAFERSR